MKVIVMPELRQKTGLDSRLVRVDLPGMKIKNKGGGGFINASEKETA
jgi:hypothetical protein